MSVSATVLVQTIRPIVIGMKKGDSNSGSHTREAKGSAQMLICVVHAMNLISKLVSGVSMLSKIN